MMRRSAINLHSPPTPGRAAKRRMWLTWPTTNHRNSHNNCLQLSVIERCSRPRFEWRSNIHWPNFAPTSPRSIRALNSNWAINILSTPTPAHVSISKLRVLVPSSFAFAVRPKKRENRRKESQKESRMESRQITFYQKKRKITQRRRPAGKKRVRQSMACEECFEPEKETTA